MSEEKAPENDRQSLLADEQAVVSLSALFDDPDPAVRLQAVLALRQIGGSRAVDALAGALMNDLPQVRRAAIVALGKLATPQCVALLCSALQDADERVRNTAVLTLGETGDAEALTALQQLQTHAHQNVDGAYLQHAIQRLRGCKGRRAP